MQFRIRSVAVAALAGALLGACRPADKPADPPAPQVVTYVGGDFSFTGPDTISSGVTEFVLPNAGSEAHHITMIRLDEGRTLADLLALPPGPMPAWAVAVGGPNAAMPGDTARAVMTLEPGAYAFICVIPSADGLPHFAKGMTKTVHVVASAGPAAAEPQADVQLKLVDYGFEFAPVLTAGRHTVRVENAASQEHEIVIVRLEPGKTIQDFIAWIEKPEGPPPGHVINGTAGMASGRVMYFTNDYTPGDYGFICFVPDAKDGAPHFVHGMISQVTIQ